MTTKEAIREIEEQITELLGRAEQIYEMKFPPIPVSYALIGKTAGQFEFYQSFDGNGGIERAELKFNIILACNNENFKATVAHEVAHYVSRLKSRRQIQPHGAEWKDVMRRLGYAPKRTHHMKQPDEFYKVKYPHTYRCMCKFHQLSSIVHNRMLKGQRRSCRNCGINLRYVETIK